MLCYNVGSVCLNINVALEAVFSFKHYLFHISQPEYTYRTVGLLIGILEFEHCGLYTIMTISVSGV